MGTERKRALPLLQDEAKAPPGTAHLEQARKQLGGRAETGARTGEVVSVDVAGEPQVGVVLFAGREGMDIWLDGKRVRRTGDAHVRSHQGAVPEAVATMAADVRLFARLREGERVRFEDQGTVRDALLLEKCRYGAIVARDDGTMVALGFRRLWPRPAGDAAS